VFGYVRDGRAQLAKEGLPKGCKVGVANMRDGHNKGRRRKGSSSKIKGGNGVLRVHGALKEAKNKGEANGGLARKRVGKTGRR